MPAPRAEIKSLMPHGNPGIAACVNGPGGWALLELTDALLSVNSFPSDQTESTCIKFCYVFSACYRSQVEIEIKKRMKAEATQDHLVRIKIITDNEIFQY